MLCYAMQCCCASARNANLRLLFGSAIRHVGSPCLSQELFRHLLQILKIRMQRALQQRVIYLLFSYRTAMRVASH